ncbi:MAG: zinc metalloprotease HtpX, partial [Chloroflexi bacterium]|nr:zinc metalloprotease HtpX [Chloroflexota bacterium]
MFKTTVLLAALMALFIGVGFLLGGIPGLVIAFVIGLGMNFFAYWSSDKVALRMAGAKEVTPEQQPHLHRTVAEVAAQAGLPKPKVYVIENDAPNAFATGRNPAHAAVAVTTGIMRILTERELRAVIGHELGHVKNRDILISSMVATIAGAISMLAFISIFFRNSRSPYAFLAIIVAWVIAPIAAGIIQASISRTREFQADRTGAELTHDPASLATALEKLHQGIKERPMEATPMAESTAHLYIVHPFKAGGLANLFSTHPPMEERVKRLRDMAYKR